MRHSNCPAEERPGAGRLRGQEPVPPPSPGTARAVREHRVGLGWCALFSILVFAARAAGPPPVLPVAALDRREPVDFQREVLPSLQANCLPCHNRTTSKADFRMETPAEMIRGGESGPAVVPGKSGESLVFQLAAHRAKPRMPPKDNKVNAVNLSERELALLALWIDQGAAATGESREVIAWTPLAPDSGPILAAAVSSDGQFAAAGRGNRIEIYHLPTARRVAQLADPALDAGDGSGPAHRDWVQALALSPDGRLLASGGFREIKFWERVPSVLESTASATAAPSVFAPPWTNASGTRIVRVTGDGKVELTDSSGTVLANLTDDPLAVAAADTARAAVDCARSLENRAKSGLETATKEVASQRDRLKRGQEAAGTADKALAEKEAALARARREHLKAEAAWEVALRRAQGDTNAAPVVATQETLAKSRAALDTVQSDHRPAALKASTAANELALAREGLERALSNRARAEARLREASEDLARARSALATVADRVSPAHAPPPLAAAFSPGDRWLAVVESSGGLALRAATNGVFLDRWRLDGPLQDVSVSFSGDDLCVVRSAGREYRLDLVPRWRWIATTSGTNETCLGDRVNALAFSPDGRWLASGSGEPSRGGEVWVWEAASRSRVFGLPQLHSDAVLTLAFSPDGRWLATGGADRFARLIEMASGAQSRVFEGHTGHVLGVGWRADGQVLATAGADLQVKYWDPQTGERRKQASGFGREVTGVVHLPGADHWVAASGDAGLRVINENGERIRDLAGGNDFIQCLVVTPDGRWLVAGGQDGVLRVWSPDQEQPRMAFDAAAR